MKALVVLGVLFTAMPLAAFDQTITTVRNPTAAAFRTRRKSLLAVASFADHFGLAVLCTPSRFANR